MRKQLAALVALVVSMPVSTVMAAGCDFDLREGAVFVNENRTPAVQVDGVNVVQQNRLIVYARDGGTLTEVDRVESGGYGNEAGIVTSGQNTVIATGYGGRRYVLMINAGFEPFTDNTNGSVSAFRVRKCGVTLTDNKSTRGTEPRAVTRDSRNVLGFRRDLVYVVNAGTGEVEFNGCPGLPEGFLFPTGFTCGERAPISEEDFEAGSILGYTFDRKSGKLRTMRNSFRKTRDEDGDPAQISFINEGRQLVIAQRNTFFALGNGEEDDIIEVFKLNLRGRPIRDRSSLFDGIAKFLGYNGVGDIAPKFTNPVISETSGNDNFGFSVLPQPGKNFNDCVFMTHGSFQQRNQGGTSVFRLDEFGARDRVIPNKADGGSDTCWTAISGRTNTLYTSAFFDSEISIRSIGADPNSDACNLTDGGPPVVVNDGVPTFDFGNTPLIGLQHRVSSSSATDGNGNAQPTGQEDFLYQAGGLDLATTQSTEGNEYLIAFNAPVPAAAFRNGAGFVEYPGNTTSLAVFRVVEDCEGEDSIYEDGCRVGDLVFDNRVGGNIPGSSFGLAAY